MQSCGQEIAVVAKRPGRPDASQLDATAVQLKNVKTTESTVIFFLTCDHQLDQFHSLNPFRTGLVLWCFVWNCVMYTLLWAWQMSTIDHNWCRTPIHWIHWIHGVWQRDGFGSCQFAREKLWKTVNNCENSMFCFSHWGRSPFQPCWRPLRAWLDFVTFLLQHFPLLQRNDLLQLVHKPSSRHNCRIGQDFGAGCNGNFHQI